MTAAGRRRRSALARDCGGSAALEFGLVVLPLLAFLFGIIEAGRLLWIQKALHYAVEAAARCASIDTIVCDNATDTAGFAANSATVAVPASVFTVTVNAANSCNQVVASYPTALNIPLVSVSLTLAATACYPR